jgi:hypothetical protein
MIISLLSFFTKTCLWQACCRAFLLTSDVKINKKVGFQRYLAKLQTADNEDEACKLPLMAAVASIPVTRFVERANKNSSRQRHVV